MMTVALDVDNSAQKLTEHSELHYNTTHTRETSRSLLPPLPASSSRLLPDGRGLVSPARGAAETSRETGRSDRVEVEAEEDEVEEVEEVGERPPSAALLAVLVWPIPPPLSRREV